MRWARVRVRCGNGNAMAHNYVVGLFVQKKKKTKKMRTKRTKKIRLYFALILARAPRKRIDDSRNRILQYNNFSFFLRFAFIRLKSMHLMIV